MEIFKSSVFEESSFWHDSSNNALRIEYDFKNLIDLLCNKLNQSNLIVSTFLLLEFK